MPLEDEKLAGWTKTRPVRVAFFVDLEREGQLVLDGIFADCYARWGGRYSLIVPCADGRLVADYLPWLAAFDPDIVYSFAELEPAEVLQIHERLVPADFIQHRVVDEVRKDARGFRPAYPYPLLSSWSVLFRLARHSSVPASGPPVRLITAWHTESESRFLADNLGCYALSAGTSVFPNDARHVVDLLTIVSDKYVQDHKYGVPKELNRLSSEAAAFGEFAHGRATAASLLSSYYAPRLEIRDYRWSQAFSLIVGDSAQDRLLFWNTRQLIPAWLDRDLCCFRITLDQLGDAAFVQDLARMLNTRNHVNNGTGGQPQIAVRSCSRSIDELKEAVKLLRAAKVWSTFLEPQVVAPSAVIPDANSLRHANELAHATDGSSRVTWTQFDWTPPEAHPPHIEPEHLADAPTQQLFTQGLWALDLRLQAPADSSHRSHASDLALPKRWRLADAFGIARRDRSLSSALPPGNRRSRAGNLTVFSGSRFLVETVTVPSLRDAFYAALCKDAAPRYGNDQPPWPTARARWIRPSNEAQYLTGVLGLAGGLSQAQRLLLHPFLRQVFASMGASPSVVDGETAASINRLAKQCKRQPIFDLTAPDDRNALATMIVRAAKSLKSPRLQVPLDELHRQWATYREKFWAAHESQRARGDSEVDWDELERVALDDCLVELRHKRLLFQGYPWACDVCKHRNWVDFSALKGELPCDVCNATTVLPVNVRWHFRANEFLLDSLRTHSTLSVIWTLSALKRRARQAFTFLGPTAFGYTASDMPSAEADLLVLLDGKAVLCEVKASWSSVRKDDIVNLVALAKRIRPDIAVFAVMEEDGKARFKAQLEDAETQLSACDIRLEVITPANYRVGDDPML